MKYHILITGIIWSITCIAKNEHWISRGVHDIRRNKLWYALAHVKPQVEKKIVITVTAYNVKNWYKRNLDSLFAQKYSNYHIIYIDDCSTDGTPQLVEQYIKQKGQQHRVTLIKNKQWLSQMANHYRAIHLCSDNDIIVNVDSDDWFAHEHVLELINKIYTVYPDTWGTYGNFEHIPRQLFSMEAIPTSVLTQRRLRDVHAYTPLLGRWGWHHPRTFYAWLFKQIKLQDLLLAGSFKPLAPSPDSAFMYPILEMASTHMRFIPDRLYMWNMKNPLSQSYISARKQLQVNKIIRSWKKYPTYTCAQISPAEKYQACKADVIILVSSAKNYLLERSLASFITCLQGIDKVYVMYESSKFFAPEKVLKLSMLFPQVQFIAATNNLCKVITSVLHRAKQHIVITNQLLQLNHTIYITSCIKELEKTGAFGFYLGLSNDKQKCKRFLPVYAPLDNNRAAVQFKYARGEACRPYSLNLVLYRKQDILTVLQSYQYTCVRELENYVKRINSNSHFIGRKVGLVYL